MYVNKLRRPDNAILKANQLKLEASVAEQKQVIENKKKTLKQL